MKKKLAVNTFFATYLVLAFTLISSAHAEMENLNLTISPGRLISFQIVRAQNTKLPTFLFLPGVNRGLLADDDAMAILSKQGFGIVTMNFSTQPFSVSELPKSVKPSFRSTTYKFEDYATEVTAVSDELKKNFGVKTVIPVSISFSGAVSSTITNFSYIIDAAPMSSSAAVHPELETYRTYLKSTEIFNPIFGPALTRSLLDQSYYKEWTTQVDSITKQFNLKEERKEDMIEGYTVSSRAAEGFVWNVKTTPATTKRVFIFGADDSPLLLKDQLNLFLKYMDATPNALAFIIKNCDHVIPTSQPEAYAAILTYLNSAEGQKATGIFEVTPGVAKNKSYQGAEAKKYINSLINTL